MPVGENWVWEAVLSPGSGPDGSGQPVRSIWTDFQPKPSILDPVRAKFDVFGPDLTSPVAARKSCRRRFFFSENSHPGFDKPCAAGKSCRRRFFFGENGHPGFDKPCAAGKSCRRCFFPMRMATRGDFPTSVPAWFFASCQEGRLMSHAHMTHGNHCQSKVATLDQS